MYVFLVIFLCVSYLVHHAWDNFDSIVHLRPLVLAAHLPFKIFSSFQLTGWSHFFMGFSSLSLSCLVPLGLCL